MRIHKSYLVNFQHIIRFGSIEVEMSDKKILPISRTYKKEVIEQMKKLMRFKSDSRFSNVRLRISCL